MMLVGAEKLSPSTVFLEKENDFIKTLLAIVCDVGRPREKMDVVCLHLKRLS